MPTVDGFPVIPMTTAVAVAAVAGTAGYTWWQERQQRRLADTMAALDCYLPPGAARSDQVKAFWTTAWAKLSRSWWWRLTSGTPRISCELWASPAGVKQVLLVPRSDAVFIKDLLAHTYQNLEIVDLLPEQDALATWAPEKGRPVAATTISLGRHFAWTLDDKAAGVGETVQRVLNKLQEHEQVFIQMLLRPVPDSHWKGKAHQLLREAEEGQPQATDWRGQIANAIDRGLHEAANGVDRALGVKSSPNKAAVKAPASRLDRFQREQLKAIPDKLGSHAFELVMRIVATAPRRDRAHALVHNVGAVLTQLGDTNYLKAKQKRPTKAFLYRLRRRLGPVAYTQDLLTIPELSALARLVPPPQGSGPRKLNRTPAPPTDPAEIVIGLAEVRGMREILSITIEDCKRHIYCIGGMGSGKSTTLAALALEVIRKGYGCTVLDPDGSTAKIILGAVPQARWDDVIYVELASEKWVTPLNLLGYKKPSQKLKTVEETVTMFKRIFADGWGPASEEQMRCASHAAADIGGTLVEVRRMLTDPDFRAATVPKIKHPEVRSYFASWDAPKEKGSSAYASRNVAPLQNKLRAFLLNEPVMAMVGQQGCIDFDEIVNGRKILIVNLNKGKSLPEAVKLVGSAIFSKLQVAGMARCDIPEDQRATHFLMMDEFQNFCDSSNEEALQTMFSEMRKYCMPTLVAHQYTGQVGESTLEGIKANVGTKLILRVGDEDSRLMSRMLGEPVTEADMLSLPNYTGYARVLYKGTPSSPFTFYSPPPTQALHPWEELAEYASQRHARPLADVIHELNDRYADEQSGDEAGWEDD